MTEHRRQIATHRSARRIGPRRRRGTVLVFVMAILVMLALMGLSMMVTTHGARRQITPQREALAYHTVLDRSIDLVRERLRFDLYADPNDPNTLLTRRHMADRGKDVDLDLDYDDDANSNEPFDIPGPEDRWLASSYPHSRDADPNLYWHRVSYLGPVVTDLADPNGLLDPLNADPDDPNERMLTNVGLFHPDPNVGEPNGGIPALTPDEGREAFIRGDNDNYRDIYDVDGNGRVDLYDADGDGIPDSPISFTFPVDTPTPSDRPKRVHVAIRIIDNNAKVNVNTASSRYKPGTGATFVEPDDLTFNESTPFLQLRGRYVGEVMLDMLAKGDLLGQFGGLRGPIRDLVKARYVGDPNLGSYDSDDPNYYLTYHNRVVRRRLLGGVPDPTYPGSGDPAVDPNHPFHTYGLQDEVSLAHRFCLVPWRLRNEVETRPWTGQLETDLWNTLMWSRRYNEAYLQPGYQSYEDPFEWHWRRWGFDERLADTDDPNYRGWQTLLDPNCPGVVKRGMLTTTNGVCDRRPANVRPLNSTGYGEIRALKYDITINGAEYSRRLVPNVDPDDYVPPFEGWPKERAYAFPVRDDGTPIRGLYDYEKVPLNYYIPDGADDPDELKADYVTMLAWAFYVSNSVKPIDGSTDEEKIADAAWQAAVNIVDYRDADNIPTVVERGSTVVAAGIERQPFITEVHVVRAKLDDGSGTFQLIEKVRVEVYNPYPAELDSDDYEVQIWSGGASVGSASFGSNLAAETYVATTEITASSALDQNSFVAKLVRKEADDVPALLIDTQPVVLPYVNQLPTWQRLEDNDTKSENYQRCTVDAWGFTIAKARHVQTENDGTGTHTLEEDGNDSAITAEGLEIVPSHWVVRNTGIVTDPDNPEPYAGHWWTFDTPGELSRVLVWGNRQAVESEPPATQLLAARQNTIEGGGGSAEQKASWKSAAGRLDHFRADDTVDALNKPDARNVFHYITALGANYDGIDNDGNRRIDLRGSSVTPDPTNANVLSRYIRSEAHKVSYRRVGVINVNSAPVPVLYAVPHMIDNSQTSFILGGPGLQWDVTAGIVALREARQIKAMYGQGGGETADLSGGKPKRFRTLGDLAQVTTAVVGDDFAVDRWGPAGVGTGVPDHVAPDKDAPPMPDYDDGEAADPAADGTNAHDGSKDVEKDVRDRDIFLARWGNILTTRSDVFTVYIALIDDDARYLLRSQFTIDRTATMMDPNQLPTVMGRVDTNYYDDTR